MMHDSNSGKAVDHIRKKKYKELPVCAVYDDDNNNAQRVIDDILCYARLDLPEYYIRALICECYWFCNEIIYDVRKSEAKWPRANTLADFLSLYVVGKPDHLAGKAYRHLMNRKKQPMKQRTVMAWILWEKFLINCPTSRSRLKPNRRGFITTSFRSTCSSGTWL